MRIRRRTLLPAAAALLIGTLLAGCPSSTSEKPAGGGATPETPTKLVLGFVPSVEADKAVSNAKPLADFLTKELGVPVEAFVSTDYTGLIESMASKKVDIGSLPTFAYVLAKDKNAAELLLKVARIKDGKVTDTYHSMFITRANSGITSIEQAKGKRMAWVEATSTSGYLFPAYDLKKKGIDPETFFANTTNAGSHDNAVRAVYSGDVDVAAVYDDARNKLEKTLPDVKQKVVPIGVTQEIPNDTIAVRAGLSPEMVTKIKAAFLKFAETPDGKATLKTIYEVENFVEAKDSDYDIVREVAKEMNIPLENFIPKPKKK